MKKNFFLICVVMLLVVQVSAQTLIKQTIFSANLKKKFDFNVWLPADYRKTVKYPVIYVNIDKSDKYLATVSNFYSGGFLRQIPPSIVVGIEASTDDLGYSYDSGELSRQGELFRKFLVQELFGFIEKNFAASKFRTLVGHSYTADYANYFFRNEPDAFSGYVLFAPEQPEYEENLLPALKAVKKPIYYFLAIAALDDEKRIAFGKKLEKDLTSIQNPQFNFKSSTFSDANHRTIIPQTAALALEHIYKDYQSYMNAEKVAGTLSYFKETQVKLLSLYGYPMQKDNQTAFYFAGLAEQSKDVKALNAFTDFFLTDRSKSIDIFNFSQSHFRLGNLAESKTLHLRAINKARLEKDKGSLFLAYRSLALNIYQKGEKNFEATWETLEKGYGETKDVGMKFYQGKFSVENKYKLDEGIRALNLFNLNRTETLYSTFFSRADVFLLIAKGYFAKNDKAKAHEFAEKVLEENPGNEEAKEILKSS